MVLHLLLRALPVLLPPLPNGAHLNLQTLGHEEAGVGGRVWDAAPALITWQRQTVEHLRGSRILELGSGTGAAGLYAAALGASVVLSDGHQGVLPLLRRNLNANAHLLPPGADVEVVALRWGEDEPLAALDGRFDWVLGSDVTYDDAAHAPLCRTLDVLLQRSGAKRTQIVLAEEHGVPSPSGSATADGRRLFRDENLDAFGECAAARGLELVPLLPVAEPGRPFEWDLETFGRADAHLFEVRQRQ